VGFELTPKQIEQRGLAAGPARHVLAFGGSRSGKTFGFTRCVAARALMAPESRHLIARLHNIDVRQSVLMDTFPAVMKACWPEVDYTTNKSDQFVTMHLDAGDSEIWFAGLDDKERVEKILGKEFATVYANECSQIPYASILTLRTRLAQKVKKVNGKIMALKAYYDLNPTGRRHWTHSEFIEGISPIDKTPMPANSRAVLQMNPADNMANLMEEYIEELNSLPAAMRARYKDGNYQSDLPNSLWPMTVIDASRVSPDAVPPMRRIVVAVDPSGSDGTGGDAQGIIVAGKGTDGHAYVLADVSDTLSPAGWGRAAVNAYGKWGADCIVAEANYGGAMVESTIKVADPLAKVKLVRATRGKHVRAEPIAALYEGSNGSGPRVHHAGEFTELEDQMAQFNTDGYQGAGSPDRADGLVWALTELMLGDAPAAGLLVKTSNRRAA
jgi:phage terminase large subunit-like protein